MSNSFYPGAGPTMQQQQQLSLMHQQQQQQQQQQQLRLDQLQQQRLQQQQQHQQQFTLQSQQLPNISSPQTLAYPQQQQQQSYTAHNPNNGNNNSIPSAQTLVSQYDGGNLYHSNKSANWDTNALLASQNNSEDPMALSIGPDGSFVAMVPRWDSYGLSNQLVGRTVAKPEDASLPRTVPEFTQQQQQRQAHPSMIMRQPQHQYIAQEQIPLIQQNNDLQKPMHQQQSPYHQQPQQDIIFTNDYLFDAPSPVPTMSSLDIGVPVVPVQQQQQQFHSSPSPIHKSAYVQQSCSPDMPIKSSPVDSSAWIPWSDGVVHPDDQVAYATPAHTHASYDSPRDDGDFSGPKHLKVFTSSKKDDDGEFRKGQQFYLNVHLSEEDRERYRYIRIPTENVVLPCRADSTGRINLNASGKRSAETMSTPTSAQEEDVLSMKLTTFLEPEHRPVVPCGRCKDKTPEILRFHPGVNGKPMIDENGMVTLRNGQVKLIASAWCASTSHHRGPGTKFSFEIELTSMSQSSHTGPLLVYQGRSDEVEIYASHGRDKGSRSMPKNTEKSSKSQSPPLHESGSAVGPPSPAKTSSPPGSPSASDALHHYDMNPMKKRREEPPMTPPLLDTDLPPVIKSLEPRRGPICQENHVIIIGQNFSRGMTPIFGRDSGKVIDINPFYIECTTPRYSKAETVNLLIYHNGSILPTDNTYEFTNEQAQSELEQMLRNLIQSDGEAGDMASYFNQFGRLPSLPSSTDISGQSQSNGSTMLHNTVLLGYQAGVELLIEEGIELDIEDDSGMTALDYAIHTNNVEITSALLYAGSIVSYERLDKLPLRPTSAMVALLKDLCDVDLPTSENTGFQDQVPDMVDLVEQEVRESHNVPVAGAVIPETIEEVAEPEEEEQEVTDAESANVPESSQNSGTSIPASESRSVSSRPFSQLTSALTSTFSTAKAAPQARAPPSRSSRPMSINTVSTQSTGMASLAPTMSTMAPSATSSMQSRSSQSMMGMRSNSGHNSKGLENIWQCAKKGNLALVKYHLEKEPTLINTPWKFDGRSVLSSACASSQPQDLVEYLVQNKAQVNCADSFHKRTPLHVLCEEAGLPQDDWGIVSQAEQEANEQDVLAAMRFLLDNGAVVDAKNFWKETPLMRLFAGRDCPLMVQELYSRGADTRLKSSKDVYPHGTAICYAAYFGRIKSLKWMIENDLLSNDEASIKEAIKWAKSSKGESHSSSSHQQASPAQSANAVRRKEERKAEAIKLLEGYLGDSGSTKRKALAKTIVVQQADGWWKRMSGIIDDKVPGAHGDNSMPSSSSQDLKMPKEMKPLWDVIQPLSESLASSSDQSSSSSGRKWNPLKNLLKGT